MPGKRAFKKTIMKVSDITLTPTLNPILKRHTYSTDLIELPEIPPL